MIRTPADAVLPSVAAGPGSDFTLSAFRRAPVGYRIDATDQRLGLNGELRRQTALARHRAGRRAILDGLTDQPQGVKMNGLTDHYRVGLFLRGHSQAESQVRLEFDQRSGTRLTLTIPLLEAMLLLQQLETVRRDAGFEFPTDQRSE
jgi:hypothetical protein